LAIQAALFMSRTSGIDIELSVKSQQPIDLLNLLMENGWSPFSVGDNDVLFLPLGDKGDFNWQSRPKDMWADVIAELRKKSNRGEAIGIRLTWKDSNFGGTFHFQRTESTARIWTLWYTHGPKLNKCDGLLDHGWFIERIVPVLAERGFEIVAVETRDY
jgi:acetolactate synthase regulatory subunit